MGALLAGLVPGLPDRAVSEIRERAEGIPLYAVETVRMMLDRGVLEQQGEVYAVTGDIEDVKVPETLHALVASRLDDLSAAERRVVQDGSVLGADVHARVADRPDRHAGARAAGDRWTAWSPSRSWRSTTTRCSPELGQYGFVQELLRTVAYATLGRRDRKARHLRVAEYLADAWRDGADDYAEVLATHYAEAVNAEPDAPDAPALRDRAAGTLSDAGRRAMSFGLGGEAFTWYRRAAEMSVEPVHQAQLLDQAARGASLAKLSEDAQATWERAETLYETAGDHRAAAVVRARRAVRYLDEGGAEQGIAELTPILAELGTDDVDADVAFIANQLARMYMNSSHPVDGLPVVDIALEYAERDGDPELLADALVTRGTLLTFDHRVQEGIGIMRYGLQLALEADRSAPALRAYNNLLHPLHTLGRYEEAVALAAEGIALAERAGDRLMTWWQIQNRAASLVELGRWDEVLTVPDGMTGHDRDVALVQLAPVFAARRDARLEPALAVARDWHDLPDEEERYLRAGALAATALVAGDPATALDEILAVCGDGDHALGARLAPLLLEAAVALGRPEAVEPMIARWRRVGAALVSPRLDGTIARFHGCVARDAGDAEAADALLQRAVDRFRDAGIPFELAKALRDLGSLRDDPALAAEAQAIFAGLGAAAYLSEPLPA